MGQGAAAPSLPDKKQINWLVDTGASDDLIGRAIVGELDLKCKHVDKPKEFATAGGIITVSEKAVVEVEGLNKVVEPWVTNSCPELLSVGKRIEEGYSFVWPHRGQPYFVDTDSNILKLQVRNNIPYIPRGGERTAPGINEKGVVDAVRMSNCSNSQKRKAENYVAPAVEGDDEQNNQSDVESFSDEDETPLSSAQRLEHLLTHLPKRKDGDTCQRAKMRAKYRYRGTYNPQVRTWGQLVTADHVSGNGLDFAIGDEIGALIIKDAFTGLVGYYGVKDKTWETTRWAIREYKGDREIQLLYSDGAPEIARAARELDILQRTSTPGVPQNNGVIEREVQECIRGFRALLLAAGLPVAFWVFAAETYGFLKNITEDSYGISPWEQTHGSKFGGLRIPFGSKVYFMPSPTKNVDMAKTEPCAQIGIFAGYALAPGYKWTGDYLVWLIDDFAEISLHRNAVIRSPKLVCPHRIRNVEIPVGPISFPLKAYYEVCNGQPGGSTADGNSNLHNSFDQWSRMGSWWIRTNRMPRKHRYKPCLESGGPDIDTLSPWRLTIKMGKDGCAETHVDNWKADVDPAEPEWKGMTIFNTHMKAFEMMHKTTVGRTQNYAESGARLADAYNSRAKSVGFDRRNIENKPWDGESPPIPLDGAIDTDFFRGEDGIWRVRNVKGSWKVDRNGVRWTKARLRPQRHSSRPVDVSVRNWHTRLTKAQKRSFHKRRRIRKENDADSNDSEINSDVSIPPPTGGESVGSEVPPQENGGVDNEMDVEQETGGENQSRTSRTEAQHYDISTPVPTEKEQATDNVATPVPTPRENNVIPDDTPIHTPRVSEDPDKTPVPSECKSEINEDTMSCSDGNGKDIDADAPIPNKRRKLEVDIARPPGIDISKCETVPMQPGSSNDHLRNNDSTNQIEIPVEAESDANRLPSVRNESIECLNPQSGHTESPSPKDDTSSSTSSLSSSSESMSNSDGSDSSSESSGYRSSKDETTSRTNERVRERSRSRSGHGPEHREKVYRNASIFAQVFVARNVSHKERREEPKAQAAMKKEWDNLRNKGCWDEDNPRDWYQIRKEAKASGKTVHMGRLVPLCVEKNSELSPDDPARKYKGRVVFQGNMVKDQDYADAEFENLGSSPATMEASKSVDAYGNIEGHGIQIADAEQAYIQADMKGKDTWILIPEEDRPEW